MGPAELRAARSVEEVSDLDEDGESSGGGFARAPDELAQSYARRVFERVYTRAIAKSLAVKVVPSCCALADA